MKMKKIREYTEEEPLLGESLTFEEYEVSLDEIAEGVPEVIRDNIIKQWKKEFDEWGEKIVLDKTKDAPIFRLELHCKNGAVIPSEEVQGDITPHSLASAFRDCHQRLEYCVQFLYAQLNYIEKEIDEALEKKINSLKKDK